MDRVECVVVGAGVIGLSIARQLAMSGREVVVLESAADIGTVTSSRNSEVIHAGIYYAPNSLMAHFCVSGRVMLYDYCQDHGIPHRRCGKLIVAVTPEEAALLVRIQKRAATNGVVLEPMSGAEACALEPALACTAALHSPMTGIIDSHAYMLALRGDAEDAGGAFAFHAPLLRAQKHEDGFTLEIGGDSPMQLGCNLLINAAGLDAPAIASHIEGMPAALVPKAYFAKGSYFSCATRAPFSRLIYPVPVPGGLGTHLTLDLAGQARFGPDVEWVETIDYRVDPERAALFYPSIRRYWPGLPDGALMPAYSGVRPKIVPPSAHAQDFTIQGSRDHGVGGLINLFGIELPGLTSSLAIAAHVAELIAQSA